MAAPIVPFNDETAYGDNNANDHLRSPGWKWSGTLAAGETLTITLLNVAEAFAVFSDSENVKVATNASVDFAADPSAFFVTPTGVVDQYVEQTKLIRIRNDSAGNTVVSVRPLLTTLRSSDFPALTEALGFDGQQSWNSAVVA